MGLLVPSRSLLDTNYLETKRALVKSSTSYNPWEDFKHLQRQSLTMGGYQSNSPKTVREQIEDSAKDLWTTVMKLDTGIIKRSKDSSSTNDQEEPQHISLEAVIRVMFGSCTAGVPPASEVTADETESSAKDTASVKPSDLPSPQAPKSNKLDPDKLYRDIFSDDRLRAEEAVMHLREQLQHQRKTDKVPSRPKTANHFPVLFPASSPQRQITVPSQPKELPGTVLKNEESMHSALSFDDGISSITQLSLDEIAKQYDAEDLARVFSDITQDPIEEVEESWKQTLRPRSTNKDLSPVRISRSNRSQGTTHTKRSYGTKSHGTKSTLSTQTNEFAGVWQREEQKYWDDVVREQEGFELDPSGNHILSERQMKLSRAREITRKSRNLSGDRSKDDLNSKRDGTITTVHSTVFSGRSSYAEKYLSATMSDPDRFLNVLIMPPGTELCEI